MNDDATVASQPAKRATTYTVLADAPDVAAEQYRAEHGFPWCDTCQRPAVYSEFQGIRHSTSEHRFGVPTHLDPHGDHRVTMREWFETPTWLDDLAFGGDTR